MDKQNIRTIIVDDEEHCISRMQKLLTEQNHDLKIIDVVHTIDQAKESILKFKPDLVFLDIQLYERTSFELLKQLKNIDFEIIFTTAYDKYAVQAFRFSAIDYLLKPIDGQDLFDAIRKVSKKKSIGEMAQKVDLLLNNLKSDNVSDRKIMLPGESKSIFVKVSDIVRCQADEGYTDIFFKSNERQRHKASKTLKHFENILGDKQFFRIHQSHLVNRAHIEEYKKANRGSVIMSNGDEVQIASLRKKNFFTWLDM